MYHFFLEGAGNETVQSITDMHLRISCKLHLLLLGEGHVCSLLPSFWELWGSRRGAQSRGQHRRCS